MAQKKVRRVAALVALLVTMGVLLGYLGSSASADDTVTAAQMQLNEPAFGGGNEPAPVPPSARADKQVHGMGYVMSRMDSETRKIVTDPANANKDIVLVRKGEKYVIKSITEAKKTVSQ